MNEYEARSGDEIAVESHRLQGGRRTGTILEVMGIPGHEYYRVRWQDGRETVFHPGPDAAVMPKTARPPKPKTAAKPGPARTARKTAKAAAPQPILAVAGDRLVIKGHHLGERVRDAEILEVLGADGAPPFRVRWADTGREGLLFPGPDALIDHIAQPRRRNKA